MRLDKPRPVGYYNCETVAVTMRKGCKYMSMSEAARVILGLRAAGWDEKAINDFVLYVETGEKQYEPKPQTLKEN